MRGIGPQRWADGLRGSDISRGIGASPNMYNPSPREPMATIYRKTPKGISEIETRAARLSPRSRGVLIMVDGRRDSAALAAMAPQAEPMLASLLADGFIEVVAAAPVAPAASAPTPLPGAPKPGFEQRRRALARALTDLLGPAAETVAIRIERTSRDADLEALLPVAVRLVATVRGRSSGEAFDAVGRRLLGLP